MYFGRIEDKYIINNSLFARVILSSNLSLDRKYPFNYIFTLHFDTYELDSYYQKLNGEYYKSKLRVRWYSDTDKYFIPEKVFIENKVKKNKLVLKYRDGIFLTDNQRKEVCNPMHWTEFIERNKLNLQIRFDKPMLPIMLSCYRRYRFYDAFSGSRISLEDCIRAYQVSPLISRSNNVDPVLKGGVLEIKAKTQRLPLCLQSAGVFKIASFSKYEKLLTQYMER